MACNFFDSATKNPEFLINLSSWINFQDDIISEDLFKKIKRDISKDFIIDSDQNLVDAIKEYISLFSFDQELNDKLSKSLDTIVSKAIELEPQTKEYSNPDPLVETIKNEEKTIKEDESISDEDRDLATREYIEQLDRSKKYVTYNEQIKSVRDLVTKFQNNNGLYNRFENSFKRNIFKRSFMNFDTAQIVFNHKELNDNIAEYKEELFNDIRKFLGKEEVPLYLENGDFNSLEYSNTLDSLNNYYKENDPTSRLNSINNRLYTKLNRTDSNYINAYNALITLENFDNLINILTNGLVVVDPYRLGINNLNKGVIKYLPFTTNALRQHFRVNEDSNIERETTSLTKAIIQSIPKLESDGSWDGYSYLSVKEFNNAIARIGDFDIKSNTKKYPSLRLLKINPTVAYTQFFKSLFTSNGENKNGEKLLNFKKNSDFKQGLQGVLISIYKYVFDDSPNATSLHNIVLKNQNKLDFNYYLDVLSYMNKQNQSEYTSYEYNQDSKEYEIKTLSGLTYEGALLKYENNLAEYIDQIAKNGDSQGTILNTLRTKFGVKMLDNSINITLGDRTLNINGNMNLFKSRSIDGKRDLNSEILDSIYIPSVTEVGKIINGEDVSKQALNGYYLLELLQLSTDLPFVRYSGQLYSILKNQYKSEFESALKGDLLNLLYNSLKTIDTLDGIYNEYHTNKPLTQRELNSEEFKAAIKKTSKSFNSLSDTSFNRFFTRSKVSPKLKANLSDSGERSSIFKSVVEGINILNRESSPSTYKNSSGDNVPAIGLMNLVKEVPEFINVIAEYREAHRTKGHAVKNIFSKNLFFNSPELIKGITLKTEFVNSNGDVTSKSAFNISEYGTSSVILDYYKNLLDDSIDHVEVLPTVYADKSNQSLIKISKDIKFNGKSLKNASASDIELTYKESQKTYYENILSNIFTLYNQIGSRLGVDIIPRIEDSTDKKKKAKVIQDNIDKINDMLSNNWKAVSRIASELNLEDPDIKFIDEVHFSKVETNKGKVMRMNPYIEYMCKVFEVSTTDPSYYNNFIKRSKDLFIQDIQNKGIEVDTDSFKFLNTVPGLKTWISKDGFMDVERKGKLNPIFEKFFMLDGFLSTQFLQVTVGEPFAHPSKLRGISLYNKDGSINEQYYFQDHAARLIAQYKRMVAMQATIHNYYQASLTGTPSDINVAVIEDLESPVFNPSGEEDAVKALDGSMECTPFQNMLENNSMFSSTAGTNRKNFGYNIDPVYGNGLLMKCAIFSNTNYRMRLSPEKVHLLSKMTNRRWSIPVLDIMTDFGGNKVSLKDIFSKDIYYLNKDNGKYYKIIDILSLGNNTYNIVEREVNENGVDTPSSMNITRGPVTIDTNYKLWEALGAEYSYELDDSNPLDSTLRESETSVEATTAFMNNVGFYKTQEDLQRAISQGGINFKSNIFDVDNGSLPKTRKGILSKDGTPKVILDQNHVFQPMKHSDIHYLANTTSIKVGSSNINPVSSRFDNTPLNSFKVGTQFMGIQMDADHHADTSTVTESTQIISTLAANGFTQYLADSAYRALGKVVETTLRDSLKAQEQARSLEQLNQLGEYNKTLLYKILAKAAIKSFLNSPSNDGVINGYLEEAAREFENNLNNELFNAKDLRFKIPFSAGTIHNSFVTMMASKMNSDSIKRTFSGMGAVMIPSHGSIKYYDFDGSEGLQDINGNSLVGYYSEYDLFRIASKKGLTTQISPEGQKYSILKQFLDSGNIIQSIPSSHLSIGDTILNADGTTTVVDTYDKFIQLRNLEVELTISKGERKDLQPFRATWSIEASNKLYNIYDHPLIADIFKLRRSKASNEEILKKQHEINNYIGLLEENIMLLDPRMPEYNDIINFGEGVVDLKDGKKGVRVQNMQRKRAQTVVSKVYQSTFGLQAGDSIADIKNSNGNFFKKKLLKTYTTAKNTTSQFDIMLLRNNLNNTRVLIKNAKRSEYIKSLTPMEILTEVVDGVTYRLDGNKETMYPVSGLSFYQDISNGIHQEVIVVDPSDVGKIKTIFNAHGDYSGVYYNFLNGNVDNILNYINTADTTFAGEVNKGNTVEDFNSLQDRYINSYIDRQAKKMQTSFNESLNITANRIPAQAFQSIMTMEIVGFSDSDSNEAYVSSSMLWLQGSDY